MEESPYKGRTGIIRLLNAVRYSINGFRSACRHEDAFRMELLLALILIPTALLLPLPLTGVARALLVFSVLAVLLVELLNSALEAAVDRISFERHPLIERAKDMGSAAVFLSLINAVVVWGLVLTG